MARLEWIEQRLQNWARWRLSQGSGVLGYAGVDLTDPNACIRDPYADAPIPTNAIEASETEGIVQKLTGELRATVLVWYVGPDLLGKSTRRPLLPNLANKLKALGCSESTLHARIARAHRVISNVLTDKQASARAERQRVEVLQRSAGKREFYGPE